MKKTKIFGALLVTVLAFALFSCSSPSGGDSSGSSGNNNGGGNAGTDTSDDQPIKGSFTEDTTWTGKDENGESITYYINSTLQLKSGCDLVIEEGAIVKFGPDGGITVNNTASLTAKGVIFTSSRDSRGRYIKEAGDVDPAPGNWKQIKIYGGTGDFKDCEFCYGGNGYSTLFIDKYTTLGKAKVDHCTFKYNYGSKKTAHSIDAALKFTSNVEYDEEQNFVRNCKFENNVWPLSIPADFTLDNSNIFGTSESDKNEYNYVQINSAAIKNTTVWYKQSIPYLYVGSSTTSTINIGTDSGTSGKLIIKGGSDSENPNLICFATAGINVNKMGVLDVEDYVTFSNSPESATTPFTGIYCDTSRKYKQTGNPGISNCSKIILTESTKILMKNCLPTGDHYKPEDQYYYIYSNEIKNSNYYDLFVYDYTN